MVSELLDGETLRQRIGESPLPKRKALDYAGQIAKGLAAAHDKGIVHRDLKPDNLFVTRDGRVKILDFGLAKMTEAPAIDSETGLAGPQTGAGTVLGTIGYMSPEQVRGQKVDQRSDIFSFGVVLLRDVDGAPRLPGRLGGRDHERHPQGRSAARGRQRFGDSPAARPHRPPLPGEEP